MKRFFCTICQKVKRVQSLPIDISPSNSLSARVGSCDYHSNPIVAKQLTRMSHAQLHRMKRAEMKSKSSVQTNQVNTSKKRKVS